MQGDDKERVQLNFVKINSKRKLFNFRSLAGGYSSCRHVDFPISRDSNVNHYQTQEIREILVGTGGGDSPGRGPRAGSPSWPAPRGNRHRGSGTSRRPAPAHGAGRWWRWSDCDGVSSWRSCHLDLAIQKIAMQMLVINKIIGVNKIR